MTSTFLTQRLGSHMPSLTPHLRNGMQLGSSIPSVCRVASDCTQLEESISASTSHRNQGQSISTLGYHRRTRSLIWTGKWSPYSTITPPTQSSLTSGRVSTGNGRALRPFWTSSMPVIARRLWSPTETDCVALDTNSWNGSHRSITAGSWCTPKVWTYNQTPLETLSWQRTCWQSLHSSLPKTTVSEQPRTNVVAKRVRKIALKLTTPQKLLLNKWFNVTRFVYNSALAAIKARRVGFNLQNLRNMFVKTGCRFLQLYPLVKDQVPFDVRDEAIRDLIKAFKSNKAKIDKNRKGRFELHFKRKKAKYGSMAFLKKHWNLKKGTYCHRTMKDALGSESAARIRTREPMPSMNHDGRIIKENGRYYIVVIQSVSEYANGDAVYESGSENQGVSQSKPRLVSIDPGVRTFLTCYDPNGAVVEIGKGGINQLERIMKVQDALKSKLDQVSHKQRYRLKRKIDRLYVKTKNLVDSVHYTTSKWLSHTYDYILLPRMDIPRMVRKERRKLNRRGARNLLAWGHCRFHNMLQYQCSKTKSHVVMCTEEYTSVTCGRCGVLNTKLGSSKEFECISPGCGYTIDRDFNGARNIMLKALGSPTLTIL
jgi:putative transposase